MANSKKSLTFALAKSKIGFVAQLNRASDYGSEGWGFESLRSHSLNITTYLLYVSHAIGFFIFYFNHIMLKKFQIRSNNQTDTKKIARLAAPLFQPGDLIILDGDLGAGKTHFVKGFTEGFQSEDPVTSPTFSIANFYRTDRFDILHIDLYRIATIEAFNDLGLTDYFDQSVVCIEWGTKFADYFDAYMLISFESKGDNERLITFAGNSDKYSSITDSLKNKLC